MIRGPPSTVYLRGGVAGEPGSVAILSVRGSGEVQGMAFRRGGAWALGKPGAGAGGLRSKKARPDEFTKPVFKCGDNHDGGLDVPAGQSFPGGRPGLGANRKLLQVRCWAGHSAWMGVPLLCERLWEAGAGRQMGSSVRAGMLKGKRFRP